jgi:hypothetical protein
MSTKKIIIYAISLLTMLAVLPACQSIKVSGSSVEKPHARYGVAMLPSDWQQQRFKGADLFFLHREKDATTAQMLVGMGKYRIIAQERRDVGERQALISEVDLMLDGVPRYLKVMVMRKNRCVFDAVLSSPSYDADLDRDFDQMIKTFWAEADL